VSHIYNDVRFSLICINIPYSVSLRSPMSHTLCLSHIAQTSLFVSLCWRLTTTVSLSPASCIHKRYVFEFCKISHTSHATRRSSPPTYPPQNLNHEPRSQHRLHARPSLPIRVAHQYPDHPTRLTASSVNSHVCAPYNHSIRAHIHHRYHRRSILLHSGYASSIACTSFSAWYSGQVDLAGVYMRGWDGVGGLGKGVDCGGG
jgi:hypothetical protein